jgi:lactoylglutathione lyase
MQIEHVAVWTAELERLRAFYEHWFGAVAGERYERAETGFASYFLEFDGGARLELMSRPDIPVSANSAQTQFTGLVHLALALGSEEEVDRLTAALAHAGVEILDRPRRTGDGYYESAVLDPDGNRIELTV